MNFIWYMFAIQCEGFRNQPSNSTSLYSDNALHLLVLVAGMLYWGLQVMWCLHFQFGVAFWRALKTSILNTDTDALVCCFTFVLLRWTYSRLSSTRKVELIPPLKIMGFFPAHLTQSSSESLLYHSLLTGVCKFHLTFTLHGSFRNKFGVGAIFETVWKAARYTYYDLIPCTGAKQ